MMFPNTFKYKEPLLKLFSNNDLYLSHPIYLSINRKYNENVNSKRWICFQLQRLTTSSELSYLPC